MIFQQDDTKSIFERRFEETLDWIADADAAPIERNRRRANGQQ